MKRGIPQGSPLSPLLANLFLTDFDQLLEAGEGRLIRYADDFIVLAKTEEAAQQALRQTGNWMRSNGLSLHPGKTSIANFERGFAYLGVTFRGKEVMIPWKRKQRLGHMLFIANKMPQSELRAYRKQHSAPLAKPSAPASRHAAPPDPEPALTIPDDMPFLYVTQPGAIVRKAGERFLVEVDQHILLDCPCHKVDTMLLFGNVQITTQALAEALDHNVPVTFFTRYGRFRGKVSGGWSKNVELRLAQYKLYENSLLGMDFARLTVRRKIANGIAVLERYDRRDGLEPSTLPARQLMQAQIEALPASASLAEIDGHEGAAASAYFDALMQFNKSPFTWPGRKKHPSTDPLNAMMSLGYTLLMQELLALVESAGLDPALGFLHELDGNRPSLALDLMEPFRHPFIDRLVLTMVNRHQFSPDDFASSSEYEGLHFKPEAMHRFLAEYERWMLTPAGGENTPPFRRLLHREVLTLERCLRGDGLWQPFVFPYENLEVKP